MDLLIRQQQRLASISYDDRAQAATLSREYERVGQGWEGQPLSYWLNQSMSSCAKKRLLAIEALGKIGPAAHEVTAQLKRRLLIINYRESRLGLAIFEALRLILRHDAIPFFRDVLKRHCRFLCEGAARELARLGAEGLTVLEEALDNVNPYVRMSLCSSLHWLSIPHRGRLLRRLLIDPSDYCRSQVMNTLAGLGMKESGLRLDEVQRFILSELVCERRTNRISAMRTMGRLRCYSSHLLEAAHQSSDPRVRLLALISNQGLSGERVEQMLVDMRRENFHFRKQVIKVFAQLPRTDKEGVLEKIFWTENRVLQINIALALERIGSPRALEVLRRLYSTKKMRVKVQILEAVARLSARDQRLLSSQNAACLGLFDRALKSHRTEVVNGGIRALGYWRGPGALEKIEEVLSHSQRRVRQTILMALSNWERGPERTRLLQRLCQDRVPTIAAHASVLMRPPL